MRTQQHMVAEGGYEHWMKFIFLYEHWIYFFDYEIVLEDLKKNTCYFTKNSLKKLFCFQEERIFLKKSYRIYVIKNWTYFFEK